MSADDPFMVSARDDALLGSQRRADGMGFLALWSDRARRLVPHLTEQTTSVRGFQILVTAFHLLERFPGADAPDPAKFFLVVEQAFARLVAKAGESWEGLPGTRRVNGQLGETRCSLADRSLHLMYDQQGTGLWGLYRGAAGRAGLLDPGLARLSDATQVAAARRLDAWTPTAIKQLFDVASDALQKETVSLARKSALKEAVLETFRTLPLAAHLRERLIEVEPLNKELARRLLSAQGLDHREILTLAAAELPEHAVVLLEAVRCEDLLAVVESVFDALCAGHGRTLSALGGELPVELEALARAKDTYQSLALPGGYAARRRHDRLISLLDVSSTDALLRSVLALHEAISEERGTAVWVWEEAGTLRSDKGSAMPGANAFRVGITWRNDYYLAPLRQIASELGRA